MISEVEYDLQTQGWTNLETLKYFIKETLTYHETLRFKPHPHNTYLTSKIMWTPQSLRV